MAKIRVLIVDDAVVIRKILTDVLSADGGIEVVGTAANGRIGFQKISQVNPDIVILDVEMPELNGLDTIPLIRKDFPKLPIIMFSTLTERGRDATMEALSRGATDYVAKPANVGSVSNAKEVVKEELIRKIKTHTNRLGSPSSSSIESSVSKLPMQKVIAKPVVRRPSGPIQMVVIGVSTGGPNALAKLIPELPADFPVPILIVQHMPPMFTRLLAERLDTQSSLEVVEASDGMKLQAGTVYFAPGDSHLEAKKVGSDYFTLLQQGPKENSCRPAVDVLFRSVVPLFGANTLAVILTGMGQDGLRGCTAIKESGGCVFVQDQATSVVWGMPGYVAEAGLADAIFPLDQLAREITNRVMSSRISTLQAERRPE